MDKMNQIMGQNLLGNNEIKALNNINKPHLSAILKIKNEAFGEYKCIGLLPQTFHELIKLISFNIYPNNFCLNYYNDNFSVVAIDHSTTYKNLLKYTRENRMTEVSLFVMLHEATNEQSDLTSKFKSLHLMSDVTSKKNASTFDVITETEESCGTPSSKGNQSDDEPKGSSKIKYQRANGCGSKTRKIGRRNLNKCNSRIEKNNYVYSC